MTTFPSLIWNKRECEEQKGLSDSRNTEQDLLKLDLAGVLWGRGNRVRCSSRCCLQSTAAVYQAFSWVLYMPYLWSSQQLCHFPFFTKEETGWGHSISHIVPSPRTWYPHVQKIMEEWTNEWMNGRVKVWSASAAGCLLFQNTASWSLSAHCPEVNGWAEEAWSVRHQSGIMGFESKS